MPRLRKINGHYYAIFFDSRKKPKEKSYPLKVRRKDAAVKKYSRVLKAVEDGKLDPWNPTPQREHLTVADAAARFMKAKSDLRPKSREAYDLALRGLMDRVPPDLIVGNIQRKHVASYVLDSNVAPATQRHRFRTLRTFFRWCEKAQLMDEADALLGGIKLPKKEKKVPAFVTTHDLDRILATIDDHTARMEAKGFARQGDNVWLKDVILFAAYTGLRLGELCAARWSWVDLQTETVTTRHSHGFRTKSNSERVVPLVASALDVVHRLHEERTAKGDTGDGPLLTGASGDALNDKYVSKRFKAFVRKAGLDERLHFHSLRHGCASMLIEKGVPLAIIQAILGHSEAVTTEIYTHLRPEHVRRAMKEAFAD